MYFCKNIAITTSCPGSRQNTLVVSFDREKIEVEFSNLIKIFFSGYLESSGLKTIF